MPSSQNDPSPTWRFILWNFADDPRRSGSVVLEPVEQRALCLVRAARIPNEVWPLTKKATISWPDGRGCVQSAKAYSVSTVRSNNLSTGVSRRS